MSRHHTGAMLCGLIKIELVGVTVPIQERDEARIYYRDSKKGSPLILLHEYFGTGESWNGQRHVLARGYRVIIPDLRGHGRSTTDRNYRLTVSKLADDTLALMDELEIRSAHLAGCSLGAIVALRIAQTAQERIDSLMLTGVPDITESGPQAYGADYAKQVFPKIEEALNQRHGSGDTAYARDMLLRNFEMDLKEKPADHFGAFQQAGSVDAPTLLISGQHDPVFSPQAAVNLSARMTNSSLAVLPDTGHLVHLEMPGLVTELMLDHLARSAR